MNGTNKTVIITGASGGLGQSLANEFASNGWKVIGTGRSEKPTSLPAAITYKQFDASDANACASFWKELKKTDPKTEVCLINNAGGYINGGLTDMKAADYETQMKSSYFTAVYMTRELAINFNKARIINIISSSALVAHKNDSAYGAAKAASKHFFNAIQEEFMPDQYQITNIYPDNIATHGPADGSTTPEDLSSFVREQAENSKSYYLRDVTIWPR